MFSHIDDKVLRALQISIVFTLATFIQRLTILPHNLWIIVTIMVIYVGFDSGLVIKRAHHRFWGTIFGVILSLPIWYLDKLDYRFTVIVVAIDIALTFFFLYAPYQTGVIFVTIGVNLFFAYDNPDDFTQHNFIFARLLCTIVAFALCVASEYLLFSHGNLKKQRLINAQISVINSINDIISSSTSNVSYQGAFIRKVTALNKQINGLNMLLESLNYGYKEKALNRERFITFMQIIDQVNADIFALYYMSDRKWQNMVIKTEMLDKIHKLMVEANQWRVT